MLFSNRFVSADPAVSTSSTDSHAAAADAAARRRRGAPESSHVSSSSNGAAVSKSFMFSLRIADDSAELDAIIHGQVRGNLSFVSSKKPPLHI